MPRSIRFRYNPVFLPEYLSTVLISIPISALFMTTPLGGGPGALVANPHLGVAIGLYLALACWLLTMTLLYRRQFCPVIFYSERQSEVWIDSGRGEVALPHVAEANQSLGKFFGRLVRRLHIEDNRGNTVVFCDAIFDFDAVQALLAQILGKEFVSFPHDDPKQVQKVRSLWNERHAMFPATETLGDVFSRLSWRGVCLLPVAVVDVLINLATILSLSKFQKHTLMVYSAPLSLLVSGFIARFIYYYMFTSTTMNKPLGTKGK
jgi:hypothetical protein